MKSLKSAFLFTAACLFPLCTFAQLNGAPPPGDAAAQLEVRLSAIEEELRNLRGKIEENDYQIRKLSDNLDKLQKDTDFRFNDLTHNKPAGAAANDQQLPAPPAGARADGDVPPAGYERRPLPGNPVTAENQTTAGDGVLKMPANASAGGSADSVKTNFGSPREHYQYAFRLLNQTQYEDAAKTFDAFTKQYPKDPLIGNAYYWEGETYYIRHDYSHAADDFRLGFEALPNGPKAPDNLLKLAMSLDALGRGKEACVVLQQIPVKFQKSSTNVVDKASQEQKRIGCQS